MLYFFVEFDYFVDWVVGGVGKIVYDYVFFVGCFV